MVAAMQFIQCGLKWRCPCGGEIMAIIKGC